MANVTNGFSVFGKFNCSVYAELEPFFWNALCGCYVAQRKIDDGVFELEVAATGDYKKEIVIKKMKEHKNFIEYRVVMDEV